MLRSRRPADSPAARYRQQLAAGTLTDDAAQGQAVALLDDLYFRLEKQPSRQRLRLWRRETEPVRGLYLWGGVGRGKTMLMDLFHDCLSVGRVRVHFHRFMHQVHDDLHALRGRSDPLRHVADRFADGKRLLCFDEFFVSDIGDAMILGELLRNLFERGVTLVATSNVQPRQLYENGLQRRRFLPAIASLERHTLVHRLDGVVDHRLRALKRAEIYHQPLDDDAQRSLAAIFAALVPGQSRDAVHLDVNGRRILARRLADDVAWFEFAELCEGPRSQNDYIEIARCHQAVLVSNVKRFDASGEDAARRFISLVDEFYDRNVKLIVSAEVPVAELYGGQLLRREFERTGSRLVEMQSHAYLARSHKAG